MGKAGRFACIFLPMALTIASLICQILVFSGQTNKDMSLPRDSYFFKADTSEFTKDPDTIVDKIPENEHIDNESLKALQGVASSDDLEDFYLVGLWNYCEGKKEDGKEKIKRCSPRKANFWFNPIDEWELEDTVAQQIFDDKIKHGLDAYEKVSKWMFAAFVIAFGLTVAEFVVGLFAIFSRWGSCVTTIVSSAQTAFTFAAALTATLMYGSSIAVFKSVLKPYKIKASYGNKMLAVMWIGVAFSVASGFFWLISICCCSGKSDKKKTIVEKAPYTYERVPSPYLGNRDSQQTGHLPPGGHGNAGSAYEPFRQQHV